MVLVLVVNLSAAPSPAGNLEPREAELVRQPGAGGPRPEGPAGGPPLRLNITDTEAPGVAAGVAARCRELGAAWDAVRGIVPRLEVTPVAAGPGGGLARQAGAKTAWTPEAAGLRDLDGPAAQSALRKMLAQLPVAARTTGSERADGVAVAAAGTGRFSRLDARRGAGIAVAECLRRLTCAGVTPALVVVEIEVRGGCAAGSFLTFADGLLGTAEAARVLEVPVFTRIREAEPLGTGEVAPRVEVSGVGRVTGPADGREAADLSGDTRLILLGETPHELGGSAFLTTVHGQAAGAVPVLDLPAERRLQLALGATLRAGLLTAAQPIAEGGLMVAACALLMRSEASRGTRLDLSPLGGGRADAMLFGESQSCVIATVASERVGSALAEAHMRGVPAVVIGKLTDEGVLAVKTRALATEWPMEELRRSRPAGGDA